MESLEQGPEFDQTSREVQREAILSEGREVFSRLEEIRQTYEERPGRPMPVLKVSVELEDNVFHDVRIPPVTSLEANGEPVAIYPHIDDRWLMVEPNGAIFEHQKRSREFTPVEDLQVARKVRAIIDGVSIPENV